MKKQFFLLSFAAMIALALSSPACVDRKETIQIHRDGSASLELTFTADRPEELYPGRTPEGQEGWIASATTEVTREGKVKHVATFRRDVPPADVLPSTYGPGGKDEDDIYIRFPTRIAWEQGPRGTICDFSRTYDARPFACVEALKVRAGGDRLKKLEEKNPASLSGPERVELVRGLVRFELLKKLFFARDAFEKITPEAPQSGWLEVYESTLALGDTLDYAALADLLSQGGSEGEPALTAEADRFEARAKEQLLLGLKDFCGYTQEQCAAFTDRFDREERRFHVTEELEGEHFEISVEMPGEILATNADRVEGNRATWEFSGSILRDANLELLASSKVAD